TDIGLWNVDRPCARRIVRDEPPEGGVQLWLPRSDRFRRIIVIRGPGRGACSPSVDAPFQARENVGIVAARGRMLSSVRPSMRQEETAAGLYGSSRTGSRSPEACSKHSGKPWLSRPRLADCCAILSFRSPSRP